MTKEVTGNIIVVHETAEERADNLERFLIKEYEELIGTI